MLAHTHITALNWGISKGKQEIGVNDDMRRRMAIRRINYVKGGRVGIYR